ncbi:MAG TPA: kelch repeat-containing protein [Terriglobales bacterium]|nr:kelch repeat-containing protein [Terriglobales bacterium]
MIIKNLKALVLCLVFSLFNCGGGSSAPPPPLSVSPSVLQIFQGATEQFSANGDVNWSVSEGSGGGTITAAGLYTAPAVAGTFHVVATSRSDPSKSATATITVLAISVSISPNQVAMTAGESISFTASVAGSANQAVSWTVLEGPAGGSVSTTGKYTAPAAFGTFHVVASSQASSSQSAQAVVTVQQASVSVSPSADVLGIAGVRPFFASVIGALNQNVIWSVLEGASGGSITSDGLYTAPGSTGNFHAVAMAAVNPSLSDAVGISVIAHGFRPTGGMFDGRSAHSATVLSSGKVLIAGGDAAFFFSYYYGNSPLDSAELYDPTSGTFSSTLKMGARRSLHTATLLTNGKVLLAGGGNVSGELFDPATSMFSATGAMTVGRSSHTATLLRSGKVLIVGGQSVSGDLASAELYDPATGTFSATGSMVVSRSSHTATLLQNGKVLITGGVQSGSALASAELYDPSSGTFSAAGKMSTARTNHTATLLTDGTVLIAGGTTGQNSLSTTEIYNPVTNSFVPGAAMVKARDSHIAVRLPSGMVLLAGGSQPAIESFTAELYDPSTGTFAQTGSMSTGRALGAAALLPDGRVLMTGGSDTASADIFQ